MNRREFQGFIDRDTVIATAPIFGEHGIWNIGLTQDPVPVEVIFGTGYGKAIEWAVESWEQWAWGRRFLRNMLHTDASLRLDKGVPYEIRIKRTEPRVFDDAYFPATGGIGWVVEDGKFTRGDPDEPVTRSSVPYEWFGGYLA